MADGDVLDHRDDAGLRGGIGGLADLAVLGGDGGGADEDAAPTIRRDRIERRQGHRRFGDQAEGAGQVDRDRLLEGGEVMGDELAGLALLRDDAAAGSDAGAVDDDAGDAMGGAGFLQGSVDRGLVGDVAGHEQPADLLGDRFATLGVEIEQRDLDAMAGEHARRAFAETGSAARDDGGKGRIELHGAFLKLLTLLQGV